MCITWLEADVRLDTCFLFRQSGYAKSRHGAPLIAIPINVHKREKEAAKRSETQGSQRDRDRNESVAGEQFDGS